MEGRTPPCRRRRSCWRRSSAPSRPAAPACRCSSSFLGLGMLLGSDGPGGIQFDDPELARTIGVVGLVAILFEGGLTTAWRGLRPVLRPPRCSQPSACSSRRSSPASRRTRSSTTSTCRRASCSAPSSPPPTPRRSSRPLRFTPLRRRLARVLEAESGGNDPIAVALTIGLIGWIEGETRAGRPRPARRRRARARARRSASLLGLAASWTFARLPASMDPFVPVASIATAALAYGLTDVAHGSGFLAVYVVGLFVGNTRSPFRHAIVVVPPGRRLPRPGRPVRRPRPARLPERARPGRAPGAPADARAAARRAAAGRLALDARPGLHPARARAARLGGPARRRADRARHVRAVRGDRAERHDLQRRLLRRPRLGARCRGRRSSGSRAGSALVRVAAPPWRAPIEVGVVGLELLEYTVRGDEPPVDGSFVRELGLPREALVAVIVRHGRSIPPRGSTRVEAGDQLFVLTGRPRATRSRRSSPTWRR